MKKNNNKEEHLKNLQEIKAKIKANSKDSHFVGSLLNDLLVEHKQYLHQPLHTYDLGKEIARLEGETFYIAKHENGALYHARNNFEMIVQPTNTSLYKTLVDLVDNQDMYDAYEGEEKEAFESFISAFAYIQNLHTFVYSDIGFMFDVASLICKFLREQYDRLMNEPLQEETPKENEEFKEAVLAGEALKEAIKENE